MNAMSSRTRATVRSGMLLLASSACRSEDVGDPAATDTGEPAVIDCEDELVPLAAFGRMEHARAVRDGNAIWLTARLENERTGDSHQTIIVLDGCPTAPRTIVDELDGAVIPPLRNLPWWIAYDEGAPRSGSWLIDPLETGAEHFLSEDYVASGWSLEGLLQSVPGRRRESMALQELSIAPDGELRTVVLHDDLRTAVFTQPDQLYRRVVAVTSTDDLVIIDVLSRAVDVVRSSVLVAYPITPDADVVGIFEIIGTVPRSIVYQPATGTEIGLGRPEWSGPAQSYYLGGVIATAGPLEPGTAPAETQLVLVPEMRELWWPLAGAYTDAATAPDGTRLLVGEFVLLQLEAGADSPEPIYGVEERLAQHAVTVEHEYGEFSIFTYEQTPEADQLVRVYQLTPGDSVLREVFDHPVLQPFRLGRDRWVYLEPPSKEHAPGELWLHDPARGFDRLLARHVAAEFPELNLRVSAARGREERSELLFRARESSMDTIWRARFDSP
jgi:hypothetical protein